MLRTNYIAKITVLGTIQKAKGTSRKISNVYSISQNPVQNSFANSEISPVRMFFRIVYESFLDLYQKLRFCQNFIYYYLKIQS